MGALAANLSKLHEPAAEDFEPARLIARQFSRLDRGCAISLRPYRVQTAGEEQWPEGPPITIPFSILRTIFDMLVEVANGNGIAAVPVSAESTTQQAADLLNVSRTYLVKLFKQRVLPHRMVGTHRKLFARDVLHY